MTRAWPSPRACLGNWLLPPWPGAEEHVHYCGSLGPEPFHRDTPPPGPGFVGLYTSHDVCCSWPHCGSSPCWAKIVMITHPLCMHTVPTEETLHVTRDVFMVLRLHRTRLTTQVTHIIIQTWQAGTSARYEVCTKIPEI